MAREAGESMTSAKTPGQLAGQRIRRREDPRLIQGLGTYVDDVKLPGMLYLAFKRSDMAHGTITRIDASAAEAMPGVELVLTGADLKSMLPPMTVYASVPTPERYSVAVDRVRHVGEAVAVVVAQSRYQARDAANAILVEIAELPAVVDPEEATKDRQALIHEGFENNVALSTGPSGTGVDPEAPPADDAAIDEAFARAEVTISQRMVNQRLAPTPLEARGVLAHYEPGKQSLTVWVTTQSAHIVRSLVAPALGMGEHQVRVIAPDVGGGFGCKTDIYAEGYVTAAVSKRLGKPVKWIEDRSEAFLATTHGRDVIGYIDLAAKRDGTILGLKARLIADIGAYQALWTAEIPTGAQAMLSNVYDIPAVRSELVEVFTNKTPTDAYRGAGRPEGIYFVERAIDMLARELNMDPAAVRRKNFIRPEQFPFTTQTGLVYDTGEYARLLDKVLESAEWERCKAERDAAQAEGRLVGLGLAYYVEICGLGPSSSMPVGGWEHGAVTVERSGTITATTGSSSHGQGHETTFSQLIADEFGVPMEGITILHGDTAIVKQGVGTFGSRSLVVGGTALKLAAGKVKAKMATFAAQMLEAQPQDMVFRDGMVSVAGVPESGIPFADVSAYAYVPVPLPAGTEPGLSEEAFWEPEGMTYPYGCYIAQVEVDRETGEITLQNFVGVDDCGTVINPLIVDGQIHGGLAQGIGQAMLEEVVYDGSGQLLTGSLMDYAIPRATDLPPFQLDRTVTPSPLNPLGAKGIGEAGTIGSAPAIVNAVVDALSPFGVSHIDMMLRPEKLWQIMQGERS